LRLNQPEALYKSFEELARDEENAHKRLIYDLWARRLQEILREPEQLLWNNKSILIVHETATGHGSC
jgi:hypothetical protein